MTLAELLALIPDNETGDIGADDLRTIVTDLYGAAHTAIDHFAFEWTTSATPAAGKAGLTGGWTMSATALLLSETTVDGEAVPFGMLSTSAFPAPFRFGIQGMASRVQGSITGVGVDQGNYRSIPITPSLVLGTAPASNTPLLFLIAGEWIPFG